MGDIPDLATVRDYVKVPATVISDADLERMRITCLTDQIARCQWPGMDDFSAYTATVDDKTLTFAVAGGERDAQYTVNWGDGSLTPVTLDFYGAAEETHTYIGGAHDYRVTITAADGSV